MNLPLVSQLEPGFPTPRKAADARPYPYPAVELHAWRIDDVHLTPWGRPLEYLREVDPQKLVFSCDTYHRIIKQYADWAWAGSDFPPIVVLDDGPRWNNPEGPISIKDGHNRAMAARLIKQPTIRAWTQYNVVTGRTLDGGYPEVAILTVELLEQFPGLTKGLPAIPEISCFSDSSAV